MKKTPISSESGAVVSLTANIPAANVPTQILTFTVPRGGEFVIKNEFDGRNGVMTGFPVVLDLNKADGTRISGTSKVAFLVQGPNWEAPKELRRVPYSIFQTIPRTQQKSTDFRDQTAAQLDLNQGRGMTLMQDFKFIIAVLGPDQVDWTKSYIEFDSLEGKPGEFSGIR